jgi:CheY-like chemotaxis protein
MVDFMGMARQGLKLIKGRLKLADLLTDNGAEPQKRRVFKEPLKRTYGSAKAKKRRMLSASRKSRVLLIEDDRNTGACIKRALESRGYSVVWVAGFVDYATNQMLLRPDDAYRFIGLCPYHFNPVIEHYPNFVTVYDSHSFVCIDVSEFSVALVDGLLQGDIDGPELIPILVKAGLTRIVSISSLPELNNTFRDCGVKRTCLKENVAEQLLLGWLDLNEVEEATVPRRTVGIKAWLSSWKGS